MPTNRLKQQPIRLPAADKRELRTQFGALCYRIRNDKVQVLLITSRRQGRWIIPKGWPTEDKTPAKSAALEAYEEAGVEGKITGDVIGIYSYIKDLGSDEKMPCMTAVFPLEVKRLHANYPEAGQRKRKWLSRKKAATMIDEPELRQIVKKFEPHPAVI